MVLSCVQISRAMQRRKSLQRLLLVVVLGATCMLIGDGTLTPAISVVSSITGLQQNTDIGQRKQTSSDSCSMNIACPCPGNRCCCCCFSHMCFSLATSQILS